MKVIMSVTPSYLKSSRIKVVFLAQSFIHKEREAG